MKSSATGLTTAAFALASALTLSVAGPHRAYAAPNSSAPQFDNALAISVLSPTPHTSFAGNKPIEVSAFYQGTDTNQIASLELYVDGTNAFTKRLDAPESRGVISFLIDVSQLQAGAHKVVVRAIATDAEVVSAKSSFIYVADQAASQEGAPAAASVSGELPELSYSNLSADQKVSGTVRVSLKAVDPNGKSPYVSLFIDRTFKTLRNYAPYEYDWDTTTYTNGYHTIEAYGYDDDQNVGPAQVLRVYVNNPGGRTELRTDLKDGVPTVKPAAPMHTRAEAVSAGSAKAHRPHPATAPTLLAANLPKKNGVEVDDLGLSNPFLPVASADTQAMHAAVPTKPIVPAAPVHIAAPRMSEVAAAPRRMAKASLPLARRSSDLIVAEGFGDQQLSDPFVATSGAPVGAKVVGASRRPSPLMAADFSMHRSSRLRAFMMASNILDETGGLHPKSQLSDPFIPDAPVQKQVASHTPATGFKSLKPKSAPALAAAEMPKTDATAVAPALITRDAHTSPVHIGSPILVTPTFDVAVTAPKIEAVLPVKSKPVAVHVPVVKAAKPITVAVHAPAVTIAKPKPVVAHVPAVPAVKPVVVALHAPAPTAAKHAVAVHTPSVPLYRAKGQMKVMFNHTALRLDRPLAGKNGVMFSPIRQIFEFEGGNLTWQRKTGVVHAHSESKNIFLKIGDKKATVNSQAEVLDLAPYLDEGRTMVPLSFLPMALDANVRFDPTSGHLLITTKK